MHDLLLYLNSQKLLTLNLETQTLPRISSCDTHPSRRLKIIPCLQATGVSPGEIMPAYKRVCTFTIPPDPKTYSHFFGTIHQTSAAKKI
jgi:hypothetical protein